MLVLPGRAAYTVSAAVVLLLLAVSVAYFWRGCGSEVLLGVGTAIKLHSCFGRWPGMMVFVDVVSLAGLQAVSAKQGPL